MSISAANDPILQQLQAAMQTAPSAPPTPSAAPLQQGDPLLQQLQAAIDNKPQPPAQKGEPTSPPPQRSTLGAITHGAEVGAAGLAKGRIGVLPGAMQLNLLNLAEHAGSSLGGIAGDQARKLIGKAPLTPEQEREADKGMTYTPSSNDIINAVGGPKGGNFLPQAENKAENYVDTAAQFAGGAGGLGQTKLQQLGAAGAGLLSEGAGQLTKGTPYELPARIIAGMAPFGVAAPFSGENTNFENPLQPGEQINIPNKKAADVVQDVKNSATYPDQLQPNIERNLGQNSAELVPGVKPTLGEIAGDQGIAQAQNAVRQSYPQPFQGKEAIRNTAMARSLGDAKDVGDPNSIGAFVVDQINQRDAAAAANEAKLSSEAKGKIAALGKYGQTPDEGATGNTILDARAVRDKQTSDMYRVLDGVNNADADHVTGRNAASQIIQDSTKPGQRPLGSEVSRLLNDYLAPNQNRKDNIEELRGYLSQSKELQRDQSINPTDKARLGRFTGALNQGLENTVNGLVLRNDEFYQKLLAEKQSLSSEQAMGEGATGFVPGDEPSNGRVLSGSTRTEVPPTRGPSSAAGGEGISQPEGSDFTRENLNQYLNSNKEFRQNKMMDDLENSRVIDSEGNIDPNKFDQWHSKIKNQKNVASSGDWGTELLDAKDAQRKLSDYKAARAIAKQEFEKTTLSKFLGSNTDPTKVVSKIFSNGKNNPAKEFEELVDKLKGDPDALNGLKSAVAQHINDNVAKANIIKDVNNNDIGRVSAQDQLQKFFFKNKTSLEKVYSPKELDNLEKVAMEIRRNQDYERMVNIKGQSNTAKNIQQNLMKNRNTIYGYILKKSVDMGQKIGDIAGVHFGGLPGLVASHTAGSAGKFMVRMHEAGIDGQNMMELAMYNDPEFANAMLKKFDGNQPSNIAMNRAIKTAMKLVPAAAANTMSEEKK